jgi:hypothetical protein
MTFLVRIREHGTQRLCTSADLSRVHPEGAAKAIPSKVGVVLALSLLVVALLIPCVAQCQEKPKTPQTKQENILDNPDRFFSLTVPEGYKPETVDEPGIVRWIKGPAEIYLVVGDIFQDSGEALFEALRKAAGSDRRIESVSTLKLKKGRAVFYKEKAPEDTARLQGWRLVVLTDKKVLNLDFTAPAKEFATFAPDFEKVVKSFKLRSGS